MTRISGAETLLLETLGLPFLSFVLNADEQAVAARLQAGTSLAPKQEQLLAALVSFLGTLPRAQDPADRLSVSHALGALARFQPSLGMGWASACRVKAGGVIELPERSDALRSSLLALARDLYPLFLLPLPSEEGERFFAKPPVWDPLYAHPERKRFEEAVMADATLSRLFPEETPHSGRVGYWSCSTGSGGSFQLSLFADMVLQNGWRVSSHQSAHPSLMEYATKGLDLVDVIRDAVNGRQVTITALVGITGLRLPENAVLDLPWGKLREVSDVDRQFIPPGLAGKLGTTAEDGRDVVIHYAGDVVMELQVPYKVKLGRMDPLVGQWPLDLTSSRFVEQRLETLRIALLLATSRAQRPSAIGTWRVFLNPLTQGVNAYWHDATQNRSLVAAALSEKEVKEWKDWVAVVDQGRVASVGVAIRRTLQAAAERPDPSDALVDAVIAWENLVGSRQGEPTLRVSAAMAWLLGSSANERQAVRRQVSELYNIRSDVVHGNRFLEPQEANQRRHEALDLTIRALRTLFKERPALLVDCKDSNERSLRLILDDRADVT
jgi:hypothetical protein